MSNTAILPPASHESVYGHNMSMQHQHQYYNTQYSTPPVVDPQELYGMPQEVEHQVEPASGPARATRPRSKSAAKDPNHVKRPPNAFIVSLLVECIRLVLTIRSSIAHMPVRQTSSLPRYVSMIIGKYLVSSLQCGRSCQLTNVL